MTMTSVEVHRRSWRLTGRYLWWCFIEARPAVLAIYTMRFLVAGALAAVAAPDDTADWWRMPTALGAWLCVAASVYLFDGVTDVVGDRVNGSRRPIARGTLPVPVAAGVAAAWAGLAVAGAAVLGVAWLGLVGLALLLGWAYSAPPLRLKRWTATAGAVVVLAGMATFTAGAVAAGGGGLPPALLVFAVAMSCWMGFVGALAKDLSDVAGDAATGRRTSAVRRGVPATGRRVSVNALLVAVAFGAAAVGVDPVLRWPAAALACGAVTIAVTCRRRRPAGPTRQPYRIFMTTQYVAHGAVPVGIAFA